MHPFYAPMIFTLYTLGLRYCHVAAMRWERLTSDGVIAIEETYDVSANVFSPVDQRKKAPPVIALEPRTLELVRWHWRYLTRRNHPGLEYYNPRYANSDLRNAERQFRANAWSPGSQAPD